MVLVSPNNCACFTLYLYSESTHLVLSSSGGGSLGLDTAWSGDWGGLDWALGAADGRGAGNSGGAEVTTVSGLGDGVGDRLEGLASGLAAAEGGGDGLVWLLDSGALLGDQSNTTLLAGGWLDADSLCFECQYFALCLIS